MLKISFIPCSKEVEISVPEPKPAKFYLPDWYKSSEKFDHKNLKIDKDGRVENLVMKQCMPFLDSMISGYIQELWTDVYIEKTEEGFNYYYSIGPDPLEAREYSRIPIPNNFYQNEMFWKVPWIPKLPKNYSALFVHPLNRTDLPFISTSGIQDSDVFYHVPFGNYPFILEKNFSGIIPKGTPMYQIIPIKRDSWHSEKQKYDEESLIKRYKYFKSSFYGSYKNIFWKKKQYN